MPEIPADLLEFAYFFVILAIASLVLAIILLIYIMSRVKRIQLPDNADWKTAMLATPLSVVIMLDLLDFALDFFAMPFSWAILSYLGLKPLRGVTVIESLIPGTQALPTMTAGWVLARVLKNSNQPFL